MKLSDFIMLEEEEKKLVVLHEAVLIAKRKETSTIVFLFQLHRFYVEMFCSTKTKKVTQYLVFQHTKLLQPYLESIVIDDLFGE